MYNTFLAVYNDDTSEVIFFNLFLHSRRQTYTHKFDQKNYKFSGGLHGVGASVVNALSKEVQVWVLRNSEVKNQTFQLDLCIS